MAHNPTPWHKREPKLSTVILAVLGIVDLISTLVLLGFGAIEANPIFAALLRMGPVWFILAKLVMLAGPIALIEFARSRAPKSAEQGAWVAVIAYFIIWGGQLLRLGGLL